MIKIKDIHGREVGVVKDDDETLINHVPRNWNLKRIRENIYHVIRGNRSFLVEIIHADYEEKRFTIKVGGDVHELEMKDRVDLLLERLGMDDINAQAVRDMKAPMPGLIVDVLVKEGDSIQDGQPLLILEAMKMENVLKASGESVVKFIGVKKGDRVDKNQVLIHFE